MPPPARRPLGGFLLGAAVAGVGCPDQPRRPAFLAFLGAEAAALAALFAWWPASATATAAGTVRYGLIALAGLAMGMQSGLVRALGAPVGTTYITGTWTALSAEMGRWLRRSAPAARRSDDDAQRVRVVVVGTYVASACGAAGAYSRTGAAATALPVRIIVVLMVGAAVSDVYG